jgi:hypothetical protein
MVVNVGFIKTLYPTSPPQKGQGFTTIQVDHGNRKF